MDCKNIITRLWQRYILPSFIGRGRGVGLLFTLALLTSCSQESVPTYDTSVTGLDIWLGNSSGVVYESTSYNYSYAFEEGSVTFFAQISGLPADHDRTFQLELFGQDADLARSTVRLEDYVLPAGAVSGTYQVYFNTQKLSDPTLFTLADGTIQFRLIPSNDFTIGTESHQQFTVILKNYLAKPDNWDAANFPRMALSKFFGAYSRVKYQFMIEHIGLVDFEVNYNAQTSYDEETKVCSYSYATSYLVPVMKQALEEYNATHDTPLTDEFGNPVEF